MKLLIHLILARDKFPGSQVSLDAFVKDLELIILKEYNIQR